MNTEDIVKALVSAMGKVLLSYASDVRDFQFGQLQLSQATIKELKFIAANVLAILENHPELVDNESTTNLRASIRVFNKILDTLSNGVIATGNRSVAVGKASNSSIVTGDNNVTQQSSIQQTVLGHGNQVIGDVKMGNVVQNVTTKYHVTSNNTPTRIGDDYTEERQFSDSYAGAPDEADIANAFEAISDLFGQFFGTGVSKETVKTEEKQSSDSTGYDNNATIDFGSFDPPASSEHYYPSESRSHTESTYTHESPSFSSDTSDSTNTYTSNNDSSSYDTTTNDSW